VALARRWSRPGSADRKRCEKRSMHGARFDRHFALEDAIEFHAFAPLEALSCVCPMTFLSGGHSSYRFTL
jgi:hypothetical protein